MRKVCSTQKNVVISGGAGALGQAMGCELVRRGHRVVLADLDLECTRSACQSMDPTGERATAHQLDVTDEASWQALHDQLRSEWKHIDWLVNAAGCMACSEFGKEVWQQWSQVVQVNLMGTALGCHTFAPWLSGSDDRTHVINIASMAGFVPFPWGSAYAVSKSGVVALSESLQAEWQPRNVRITVVYPGFFDSGLFGRGSFGDELCERVVERMVQRSRLTARQVALAAIDGAERGRQYVILPAQIRWLHRFKRLAPGWLVRHVSREAYRLRAGLRKELEAEQESKTNQKAPSTGHQAD